MFKFVRENLYDRFYVTLKAENEKLFPLYGDSLDVFMQMTNLMYTVARLE